MTSPAQSSTREQLLLTAERLFATHGIESVSLRQIAREGGQKNVGAMQYHFGDRLGLFEAILEYRMSSVDAVRREMLADVDARGVGDDPRELMKCLVYPYVRHIRGEGDASHYVEFLARFRVTHPEYLNEINYRQPWQQCVLQVSERLQALMQGVPEPLRVQRMLMVGANMIQSVSEFERSLRSGKSGIEQLPLFAANLVDALCGLLMAPVSEETRRCYDESTAKPA